ncbi:uncharacterized protein N7482_005060 [Penicillium canariense]|uniref:Protein-S-isoprenylcysteine O-methyltransferase n=1 Tax=Penicillium canariense TaxID=189055 RepID=A0A9W9I494_9EURO|nr:uncharacterized protein N7482_005060 [Penicillium canariense]KAJ5166279.1 hypothetical protein N7482_005060 [Penicillium canariense]
MTQASTTALAAAMMGAGYLCALCATPPNPSPDRKGRHQTDRISFIAGSGATIVRRIAVTAITYHALLTALPVYAPERITQMCPRPQNLNPDLFSWSVFAVAGILLICLGAFIRLSAYGRLSRNFTFHLAAPDQLVTSGIYSWMQHPSYTGLALIGLGSASLFLRWDAVPACWISETTLARWSGWGPGVLAGHIVVALFVLFMRVKDEEEMLRQKFGKEWEQWHRSTKRFIPAIL